MSPTMFLGRVVLPVLGLAVAAGLTWNSMSKITAQTEAVRRVESSGAAVHSSGRITAEGRVVAYPGAEVTVGTEVLGTIINMPALENAAVRKGDLLVELRADDVKASLQGSPFSADRGRGGRSSPSSPLSVGPNLPVRRPARRRRRRTFGRTSKRRRSHVAMPPRRRSNGSRPRRSSTESRHRSAAWSFPATSIPARRLLPVLPL